MSATLNDILNVIRNNNVPVELPEILYDSPATNVEYNEKRQIFNTYFQFRPTAMAFCENTAQVQTIIKAIHLFNYTGPLRVRSGGHDHEGESMGTDALVIDLSKMTQVDIDTEQLYMTVQPGIPFIDLITQMNDQNVGVPHGTCHSVRISGFVFGGGWGPWTRAKGMCCESLAGATIVLGDGSSKTILDNELIKTYKGNTVGKMSDEDMELLWALRGGGGMSYGIVTELIFKIFKLPDYTTKFTISWTLDDTSNRIRPCPAIDILKRWEELIAPSENPDLLGTNLKIVGKPKDGVDDVEKSLHDCFFYGYYQGSKKDFKTQQDFEDHLEKEVIPKWFPVEKYGGYEVYLEDKLPEDDTAQSRQTWSSFAAWDRVVNWKKTPKLQAKLMRAYNNDLSPLGEPFQLIPPEVDKPAPHKITSKLVRENNPGLGLGEEGRKTLIRTLESNLIYAEGEEQGMNCYVTLGAISGAYYKDYAEKKFPYGCSFPYPKCPYTIQYQAWWDTDGTKNVHVDPYVNRAMDWIEECRNTPFPQTKGAFISFKDSSIPTETYFQESYTKLKEIKEKYSRDPNNMFSSRKTII